MRCMRNNCADDATSALKICVPATGYPIESHQPISIFLGVKICLKHAAEVTAQEWLKDNRMRQMLTMAAAGRAAPDFDRAWLKVLALNDPELLAYEVLTNPKN